jgi:hypothetical protein
MLAMAFLIRGPHPKMSKFYRSLMCGQNVSSPRRFAPSDKVPERITRVGIDDSRAAIASRKRII